MNPIPIRLGLTLAAALMVAILPLSGGWEYIKPTAVLLVLLYLQYYLPHYFHIILLFLLGLLLDVLLSTVLGEHTFALALVAGLASTKERRFYCFTLGQQMISIGFLTALYQLIILIIDMAMNFSIHPLLILTSTLMNVLLWPWMRLLGEVLFHKTYKKQARC
jgi:rod shape-determining protein MreD